MKKNIAIVGGGPGGLTLARLLQQNGLSVKVYERDINNAAREQGTTLDLHEESGLAALAAAGLMNAFRANFRPGAEKVRILDKNANIVHDEHLYDKEADRPEIDRGPLRKILLDSLQPDTVVWDSQFVSMTLKDDKWELNFKNGTTAIADLVIAADGANSKIRPYLTPIKPFFAGVTAIEGLVYNSATVIPEMHDLLNGGKIFAFGDEKTLILSAKGDGSLAFYAGLKTPENWKQDFNFKKEFAGWDDIWTTLFEHSSYILPRPQYCMPLDQYWDALPNLTMLGDAAHLMPPYAGEGVNMAMLDALELSQCLTSFPDTHSAIKHYENNMRTRASATAAMTLEQTAILHSENAMAHMQAIMGVA